MHYSTQMFAVFLFVSPFYLYGMGAPNNSCYFLFLWQTHVDSNLQYRMMIKHFIVQLTYTNYKILVPMCVYTHIGTRYVILARHWMWLPDDGFMGTETCWSSFYNFNYFNNLRIL